MLVNKLNQPPKFSTKNLVERNDKSQGTYNVNNDIKCKTSMVRWSLCDYSDKYILIKGTIAVPNTERANAATNNASKKVIFKNFAPFTDCISKINNTQLVDGNYIDAVIPEYNLIEYSDIYWKASRSLWRCFRDEPALETTKSLKKITRKTGNDSTKDVEGSGQPLKCH